MTFLIFLVSVAFIAWALRRWWRAHRTEVRPFTPPAPLSRSVSAAAALQGSGTGSAPLRAFSSEHPAKQRVNSANAADGTLVNGYCLAWLDGTGPKARAALGQSLSRHLGDAGVLVRQLDIAFESLAIIEQTKNIDTLMSRLSVARQSLNQASAEAHHAFPAEHCAKLIAIVDEAASVRLADLAVTKLDALKARAAAAKTEPTRQKHLAAALAYAVESARHPNISAKDRARIRERAKP